MIHTRQSRPRGIVMRYGSAHNIRIGREKSNASAMRVTSFCHENEGSEVMPGTGGSFLWRAMRRGEDVTISKENFGSQLAVAFLTPRPLTSSSSTFSFALRLAPTNPPPPLLVYPFRDVCSAISHLDGAKNNYDVTPLPLPPFRVDQARLRAV